jgi:hypothetical protein
MTTAISDWLLYWREDRLDVRQWLSAALVLAVLATAYCLLSGWTSGTLSRPTLSLAWATTLVVAAVATCGVLRAWLRRPCGSPWLRGSVCLAILAAGIAMLVCGEKLLAVLYWGKPWRDYAAHFAMRLPLGLLMFAVVALPAWLKPRAQLRLRPDGDMTDSGKLCPLVLVMPSRLGELQLAADEILRIKAAGNYVELYTTQECHLMRATLSSLALRLGEAGFLRIHRSAMVNRRHVRRLDRDQNGEWQLRMMDGTVMRVGRSYRQSIAGAFHHPRERAADHVN